MLLSHDRRHRPFSINNNISYCCSQNNIDFFRNSKISHHTPIELFVFVQKIIEPLLPMFQTECIGIELRLFPLPDQMEDLTKD